nr:hypothetical protein [Anaerolineales bacterium]
MTSPWILARFPICLSAPEAVPSGQPPLAPPTSWPNRLALHQDPQTWPAFAQTCPIAQRYHTLLAPLP